MQFQYKNINMSDRDGIVPGAKPIVKAMKTILTLFHS